MTVIADPGRTALLIAGTVVAEREGLHRLSINAVVEEAGMAKGTFYHHFVNRRSYVIALHRRFFDALSQSVAAALDGIPPGIERIGPSLDAFLDACLDARGTEAFMVQARTDPDLREEIRHRHELFIAVGRPDMVAAGWPDPDAASRLKVALVGEICLAELTSRRPRPDLRVAAVRMLTANLTGPVAGESPEGEHGET
ncbi:TetR/AcrR family transcriptional regulator [Nocardia abscessus]|uniref:TetR/AcrR family transcriptional regulator n=1 Tax=Nocardia abscessus TaxID=120957 RepID=UPI00245793B7|nr:TetR/AcrR family transcriptional regulator [Nocardia abscessus]